MARSNRPVLDELTPAQRIAIDDGAQALKELQDFRRLTFDKWMTVARGVAPLCELADRPGMSRTARATFLKENGYGTLNKSTVTRLLLMAEHETAIRKWRDELKPRRRDSWNSPTSICNRCSAVRAAMATAGKTPPRRRRTSRMNFELALDAVAESWNAADADGRAVITERLSRMMDPPTPTIDEAIDVFRDYLDELEEAERRAHLTELIEEFGFALVEERPEPPKPARKRRTKKAPAVPAPEWPTE